MSTSPGRLIIAALSGPNCSDPRPRLTVTVMAALQCSTFPQLLNAAHPASPRAALYSLGSNTVVRVHTILSLGGNALVRVHTTLSSLGGDAVVRVHVRLGGLAPRHVQRHVVQRQLAEAVRLALVQSQRAVKRGEERRVVAAVEAEAVAVAHIEPVGGRWVGGVVWWGGGA